MDRTSAPADGDCRFLFVGGNFHRKGGHLLIEAVRDLHGCSVDVVTRSEVPEQPGVRVHRNVRPGDDALERLIATSTVMVLPTLADMYSAAGIEAMAAGLPVVTTRVGGIPDIVVNGETSFLLEPGDVRALRGAITTIVAAPARARDMGRAGWQRAATHFDAGTQTALLFDLFTELHDERRIERTDR